MEQEKQLALEQEIMRLKQENVQLRDLCQKMDMTNNFKRLDYLFNVIERIEVYPEEFTERCIDEIKNAIYPSRDEVKQQVLSDDGE
ncbi:MAG: hypothetical protein LBM05_00580 [Endomicrobium sp.]|jgi:hypothetical protein|nr:hypothetical protein [Endomicrobium sp.]